MEATNESASSARSKREQRNENANVRFGQKNRFEGTIGDVAGQDIVKTDQVTSMVSGKTAKSTEVDFGESNIFSGDFGDVAGGNIQKNTERRSESGDK